MSSPEGNQKEAQERAELRKIADVILLVLSLSRVEEIGGARQATRPQTITKPPEITQQYEDDPDLHNRKI